MANTTHHGLKWIMRAGYTARGVIYVIIGGLAFYAAFAATRPEGTEGALSFLRNQTIGAAALWAVAGGFFAYMIWRVAAGVVDVEDHGASLKGIIARAGQVITGLLHGAVGASIIGPMLGWGQSGGTQSWTGMILAMPGGQVVVGMGAAILAGAGLYYAKKGVTSDYQDHLKPSELLERIDPGLKYGLVIYGIMLTLVALSFGLAALTSEAAQSGGLGDALRDLRGMLYGRVLLALAGLGLVAFAVYNLAEAKWRIVPRFDGADVATLRRKLAG